MILYFEKSEFIIGLDSFSKQIKIFGLNLVYISFCVDYPVEISKITVFSSGSFRKVNRVTDQDSISEPAV